MHKFAIWQLFTGAAPIAFNNSTGTISIDTTTAYIAVDTTGYIVQPAKSVVSVDSSAGLPGFVVYLPLASANLGRVITVKLRDDASVVEVNVQVDGGGLLQDIYDWTFQTYTPLNILSKTAGTWISNGTTWESVNTI